MILCDKLRVAPSYIPRAKKEKNTWQTYPSCVDSLDDFGKCLFILSCIFAADEYFHGKPAALDLVEILCCTMLACYPLLPDFMLVPTFLLRRQDV